MNPLQNANPVQAMLNRMALNQKHSAPSDKLLGRGVLQAALAKTIGHRGATNPLPVQREKLLQAVLRAGQMVASRLRGSQGNLSDSQKAQVRQEAVEQALDRTFDAAEPAGPQRSEVRRIVQGALDLVARSGDQLLAEQTKIEKVAKDFEGIFVRQIMDVMRKTVDESGLGEDATGKQVRDMYWMFLGEQVAQTGSLGMWKQIAADIARSQQGMPGSTLETLE
jgi:hypothetical protein